MRTPKYEFVFDEAERGVRVSDEARQHDEDDFVRIVTNRHQFEVDLRKIDKEEIDQAQAILKRMNFDNSFEMRIV